MFAKYHGEIFQVFIFMGKWYLASDRKSEALGFVQKVSGNNRYYRQLKNFREVEDLYEVEAYVSYNTGIEGVQTEWKITPEFDIFMDGCIKLWHVGDELPGWNWSERFVCYRYVPLNEIEKAWIVRTDVRTQEKTHMEADVSDFTFLYNVYIFSF